MDIYVPKLAASLVKAPAFFCNVGILLVHCVTTCCIKSYSLPPPAIHRVEMGCAHKMLSAAGVSRSDAAPVHVGSEVPVAIGDTDFLFALVDVPVCLDTFHYCL